VAGREDQASPGQDQTPGRSGSFQGGIALFVTRNLKHKAMLMITYSAGLRVSEAARLKLTDIDSVRMTVRISQGKGGKDRYSILSQTTLEHLRQYWKKYRPTEWLFEGQKKDGHISLSTIQSSQPGFVIQKAHANVWWA
jgi:site-specific recombinase XerD